MATTTTVSMKEVKGILNYMIDNNIKLQARGPSWSGNEWQIPTFFWLM